MKILVVGAGATGGYFGGRLAAAGRDVTLLVRERRAAMLRERGLRLLTPSDTIEVTPKIVQAEGLDHPFDLIILAVKAYGLETALSDLEPAVGRDTLIVPLLNGLRHIDRLKQRFGEGPVLGGVCAIGAALTLEGDVRQAMEGAQLTYGELAGGMSDRVWRLDAELQDAGFTARLSANIVQDLWTKWVMLATLGATTCLMRAPIGEIEAAPGGLAFLEGALDEAWTIAEAAGYPPAPEALARIRGMVTAKGSPMTSSMYRDMMAGAAVEVDAILGDLVLRAEALGRPCPRLGAARTALEIYASTARIA